MPNTIKPVEHAIATVDPRSIIKSSEDYVIYWGYSSSEAMGHSPVVLLVLNCRPNLAPLEFSSVTGALWWVKCYFSPDHPEVVSHWRRMKKKKFWKVFTDKEQGLIRKGEYP
jgi:hypothetical protein